MAKKTKTNAIRHLESLRIPYETREYDVSDDNFDGKLIAAKVDLPQNMIYKTLVLKADSNTHLVCVIPVADELDLKSVARVSGHKSVQMLPQKDLLPLTGYLRGGCSPIGMKKLFPTFIDHSCQSIEKISVSAGIRGCQMILPVSDLISIVKATVAPLCRTV